MEQYHTLFSPWYQSITCLIICIAIRYIYVYIALKCIRLITNRLNLRLGEDMLKAFEKPLDVLLWILGLHLFLRFAPLGTNAHITVLEKILRSFIIVTFIWGVYNATYTTHAAMQRLLHRLKLQANPTIANIISTLIHIFIIIIGFVAVAKEWGYDITGFLASLSIGSVAVAFAAKDTLANVFGSFVIIIDRPFVVGDWIATNGIEGIVEKITFRSTCIRTFPQEQVYIPNSLLSNTPIINYTKREKRRVDFKLNLTYSTTKEQMQLFMERLKYLLESKYFVIVDSVDISFCEFNSSSLDIRVICYMTSNDEAEHRKNMNEVNLEIIDIIKETGVSCAFPSTSLYFENKLNTKEE